MERRSTGLTGLDAQLGGGVPPGTVHVLFSEPMNAQELIMYHFAAGGTRLAGGTAFFATEASPEEVQAGAGTVGGMANRVQVVALPIKGQWVLPEAKPGLRLVLDSGSTFLLGAG